MNAAVWASFSDEMTKLAARASVRAIQALINAGRRGDATRLARRLGRAENTGQITGFTRRGVERLGSGRAGDVSTRWNTDIPGRGEGWVAAKTLRRERPDPITGRTPGDRRHRNLRREFGSSSRIRKQWEDDKFLRKQVYIPRFHGVHAAPNRRASPHMTMGILRGEGNPRLTDKQIGQVGTATKRIQDKLGLWNSDHNPRNVIRGRGGRLAMFDFGRVRPSKGVRNTHDMPPGRMGSKGWSRRFYRGMNSGEAADWLPREKANQIFDKHVKPNFPDLNVKTGPGRHRRRLRP